MDCALESFLRAVPEWTPGFVQLNRQADSGDVHARAKRAAFIWICGHPDHTLLEKFDAIVLLERLPEGPVTFSLPQLIGWDDDSNATQTIQ